MVLALHGVAGGWDELLIALVGFGVMWFAVKLASRKRADDEEEGEGEEQELAAADAPAAVAEEPRDAAQPPAAKLG
jgi:hypothetical protein